MIKVGIVGGTGYTGVELLRLLAVHPDVQLTAITSRKAILEALIDTAAPLRCCRKEAARCKAGGFFV